MPKLSDTSADAERILTQVYRRQSPGEKWLRLGSMYDSARALHAAGVRLRDPGVTPREILSEWLRVNLGFRRPHSLDEAAEPRPMQFLREAREVVRILDRLGIVYALSGSLASAVHGIDRYTRDANFLIEPFPGKEAAFVGELRSDYCVSDSAVREAVRSRTSFNVINTSTGFKADFFVRKDVPFETSALGRRMTLTLPDDPSQPLAFHSAEDIVLLKLRWYRLGNEVSDQQWNDVLGILRTQGDRLDGVYLDQWAAELGLSDLLTRARGEVLT